MTAEIVGKVGDEVVAVTADGKVWFGRSYTPSEAEAAARYMTQAAGLARSGPEAEDAGTEQGKFL